MDLKTRIKDLEISNAEFARRIGISKQLLHWHVNNPDKPWKVEHAKKIIEVIYGEASKEKILELVLPNYDI